MPHWHTLAAVVKVTWGGIVPRACRYPSKEGRFMQVSGLAFSFDPRKAPGSRVVRGSVRVGGEPLVADKQYKVAMKEYIQQGKVRCCGAPAVWRWG